MMGRYSFSTYALSETDWHVLINIRTPRILLTILTGIALSVGGTCLQATLRNPLVSPFILGLSQGAAFGAALVMVFFPYRPFALSISAFAFGFFAVSFTSMVARVRGTFSAITIVLGGIIVGAIFTALLSIVKLMADPFRVAGIVFWTLGGLSKASWKSFYIVTPGLAIGLPLLFLMRWRLNVLSMSEEEAALMGVQIKRDRIIVVFLSTLICSSVIAVTGIVAWIGLIIPHLARGIVGTDNRYLVPASAALGASFLLIADTLCRSLFTYEIPISIVTTLIAAPQFIYLLRRVSGGWR
jgi:iron complex transport system permease protein